MTEQYRYYVKAITVKENESDKRRASSSSSASSYAWETSSSSSDSSSTEQITSTAAPPEVSNTIDTDDASGIVPLSQSTEDNRRKLWKPFDEESDMELLRREDAYSSDGSFKYSKEWRIERLQTKMIDYKYRLVRQKSIHKSQMTALQKEVSYMNVMMQRVREQIKEEIELRRRLKIDKNNLKELFKRLKAVEKRQN